MERQIDNEQDTLVIDGDNETEDMNVDNENTFGEFPLLPSKGCKYTNCLCL